jgi:hypothetical protein
MSSSVWLGASQVLAKGKGARLLGASALHEAGWQVGHEAVAVLRKFEHARQSARVLDLLKARGSVTNGEPPAHPQKGRPLAPSSDSTTTPPFHSEVAGGASSPLRSSRGQSRELDPLQTNPRSSPSCVVWRSDPTATAYRCRSCSNTASEGTVRKTRERNRIQTIRATLWRVATSWRFMPMRAGTRFLLPYGEKRWVCAGVALRRPRKTSSSMNVT